MGKRAKGKKGKIDFDALFDSTKPQSEGDGAWHSGVSAMTLEEDNGGGGGGGGGGAAAAGGQPSTSGAVAADGMDCSDYVPLGKAGKRKGGLRVQQPSLKVVKRGSRTTAQKRRKAAKQEKALAHAEKTSSRAVKLTKKKQQLHQLKALYD